VASCSRTFRLWNFAEQLCSLCYDASAITFEEVFKYYMTKNSTSQRSKKLETALISEQKKSHCSNHFIAAPFTPHSEYPQTDAIGQWYQPFSHGHIMVQIRQMPATFCDGLLNVVYPRGKEGEVQASIPVLFPAVDYLVWIASYSNQRISCHSFPYHVQEGAHTPGFDACHTLGHRISYLLKLLRS
jgi:hypothetical protein